MSSGVLGALTGTHHQCFWNLQKPARLQPLDAVDSEGLKQPSDPSGI